MKDAKIVVYEITQSTLFPRIAVGVVGLLAALGVVLTGYYKPLGIHTVVAVVVATLLFGAALLLTWRKKGEYEIVEIKDGRVMVLNSHTQGPSFDAPASATKFQRLRLPNGEIQLYMRDGQRAVELGRSLPPKQRDLLGDQLEEAFS